MKTADKHLILAAAAAENFLAATDDVEKALYKELFRENILFASTKKQRLQLEKAFSCEKTGLLFFAKSMPLVIKKVSIMCRQNSDMHTFQSTLAAA